MSLPVVRVSGSPYEQGLQHGEALRERIAHNIAVYFNRFEGEGRLPRPEALHRGEQYMAVVSTQCPDYVSGLMGIAEGSGFQLAELAAINVRYEILYHQYTVNALNLGADDCTSFAVAPEATADGHLLLGQNWDWVPEVLGAVIQATDADGFQHVGFTEAGIFGTKIGFNSAGLGLCVNGMLTTDDDWSRLHTPFHARCYQIMRCRSLGEAIRVVTREDRSCSTNFMMAQAPDRAVDLEAAPHRVRELGWTDGILVHTNHFLDPAAVGVIEPPSERRPYSCLRQVRLGALLRGGKPHTIPQIQGFLRDHQDQPNSICRHPDTTLPPEQYSITVASVIMDLNARTLLVSDRQPCENEYQIVGLDEAFAV